VGAGAARFTEVEQDAANVSVRLKIPSSEAVAP